MQLFFSCIFSAMGLYFRKGEFGLSKIEKLIERLKTEPSDFTYKEMITVLGALGFVASSKGRTSGSRVKFINGDGLEIIMHKPHPQKEIRRVYVSEIVRKLEQEGLI